jgi:hypothetical protein
MFNRAVLIATVLLATLMSPAVADDLHGIARIPDPPPPVDGSLARVGEVTSQWSWSRSEQVTVGPELWTGAADLSGELMVGWDQNYLYLAARVRDDHVIQPFFGSHLWRGDHLELFLDLPRQAPGTRDKTKVYQIGISPGNLKTGNAAVAAEIVQWTPTPGSVEGSRVASKPTADGYMVEVAIPWKHFGIDAADEGLQFGIEVGLSDSDTVGEGGQETLISLMDKPWDLRNPDRMLEVALGNTSGVIDPSKIKATFVAVSENVQVLRGTSVDIAMDAVDDKPIVELIVRARLGFRTLAGGTGALKVSLNGTELTFDHIRNRLKTFQMGVSEHSSYKGLGWFLLYAPNYDMPDPFSPYRVRGIQPFEFRFGVADLWKPNGGNVVTITHIEPKAPADMIADVGVSETLSTKMEPPPLRPAPTGEIATYEPRTEAKPDYDATMVASGAIHVRMDDRTWIVESDFSTVEPGWVSMAAEADGGNWVGGMFRNGPGMTIDGIAHDFTVRRDAKRNADHIHVSDTITNTTQADLPVMVRHHTDLGEGVEAVYICGKEAATPKYRIDEPEHPASLGLYGDAGLALISEDDVMRVLAQNFRNDSVIGIDNSRLVIPAGESITIEFSIYPLEIADRFAFMNRVRANWGVNFTIPGSFTFINPRSPFAEFTDEQLVAYLDNKTADIACGGVGKYRGLAAHGTGYFKADKQGEVDLIHRIRQVRPQTETQVYFHSFISTDENDAERFPDDILRRPDGSHGDYRNPSYPIFVPREGSAFAAVQDELIEARWNDFDITGIYWDEMAYSAHKFDYSDKHWDGHTADIDPDSHRIRNKISSVTLATLAWRKRAAEGIMARGMLIGNGAPHTRTFTQLHFPRFIETGSITNLTRGQLYTPIALGDHLTEHTALDCYQIMLKALNLGGTYYWYYYRIEPFDEPTFTEHMFPITYIRMGEGFIIGEERILTNRSGMFGWGDESEFEAVVYGRNGKLTDEIDIPRRIIDGKAYGEVRIPEGYGVALIRK